MLHRIINQYYTHTKSYVCTLYVVRTVPSTHITWRIVRYTFTPTLAGVTRGALADDAKNEQKVKNVCSVCTKINGRSTTSRINGFVVELALLSHILTWQSLYYIEARRRKKNENKNKKKTHYFPELSCTLPAGRRNDVSSFKRWMIRENVPSTSSRQP